MLPGVMACITFAAMALCVKKADKQNRKMLYLMCFVLSCGNAVCVRIQQAAAPEALFQAAVLKFCASLPTVILVYTGYRYEKNSKMARFLLTAVTLCLAADIAINLSFAAGGFLFLSGHLFFDAAFITERKPDRKQFAQLIVSAAGGAVLLLLLYKHINSIPLYVGALTYMTVLFSTLIFSFKLDRRLFEIRPEEIAI